MKRYLVIPGLILLIVVVVITVGILVVIVESPRLDKESLGFIDASAGAILKNWDAEELIDRSSQEFLRSVSLKEIKSSFGLYAKLGGLKELKDISGKSNIAMSVKGMLITCEYIVQAVHENGRPAIAIKAIKHNGKWQIRHFEVEIQEPF